MVESDLCFNQHHLCATAGYVVTGGWLPSDRVPACCTVASARPGASFQGTEPLTHSVHTSSDPVFSVSWRRDISGYWSTFWWSYSAHLFSSRISTSKFNPEALSGRLLHTAGGAQVADMSKALVDLLKPTVLSLLLKIWCRFLKDLFIMWKWCKIVKMMEKKEKHNENIIHS